jgi:6-pyruvoyltetrahydropterin/6-carboxytetrahydropterin synthase
MTRSLDQAQPAFSTTKLFDDLPCVHRTWQHKGKCALLHGYERRFEIEFGCAALDPETGFVIDLGDLKEIRALLEGQFDHTTLIAADDPELPRFEELNRSGILDLRVMKSTGMEGAAVWVYDVVDRIIRERTADRVWVIRVTSRETRKNAVILRAESRSERPDRPTGRTTGYQ